MADTGPLGRAKDADVSNRWEYRTHSLHKRLVTTGAKLEEDFNRLGDEGWELVAVVEKDYAIFKRPSR